MTKQYVDQLGISQWIMVLRVPAAGRDALARRFTGFLVASAARYQLRVHNIGTAFAIC